MNTMVADLRSAGPEGHPVNRLRAIVRRRERAMTQERLIRIRVVGFRSLRDVTLEPGPVTVLIGPNGAGRSNLLGALNLVQRAADGFLPPHVGLHGGASFLMHRGPKSEGRIAIELEFGNDAERLAYTMVLEPTEADGLAFGSERVGHTTGDGEWTWLNLGQGHADSRLRANEREPVVGRVRKLLRGMCSYHFHDTSRLSELRTNARQSDDRTLAEDGGNLAAVWLRLKDATDPAAQLAVGSIEGALRMVVPGFASLEPTPLQADAVRLDWIDDQGQRLHCAHLSDGALRLIAILNALGQPADMRPRVMLIDEPELGLHPAALELLCESLRSASNDSQLLLATQAPQVLHHVSADEIVVVERQKGETALVRKSEAELAGWLSEYNLADLYAMNILGGRP